MRITEGQLRRIIREELNEMGMKGDVKGATLSRDESGNWVASGEDFPGEGAAMARAMGAARRGTESPMGHIKQDIISKLGMRGLTERGIIMSLSKYKPAQVEAALESMMMRGDIDMDEAGVYHIAGYEEYESPEVEEEPSEEMEYDPEDPYGGLPKGSRIPGRGLVHTAGFRPGENPFKRRG